MNLVISDTSPIRALEWLGLLNLLQAWSGDHWYDRNSDPGKTSLPDPGSRATLVPPSDGTQVLSFRELRETDIGRPW